MNDISTELLNLLNLLKSSQFTNVCGDYLLGSADVHWMANPSALSDESDTNDMNMTLPVAFMGAPASGRSRPQ